MQGLPFPPGLYGGLEDDGEFRPNLGPRLCSLENKEDVLRVVGRCLVLPLPVGSEGKYRTPVVTLHNTEASNLYSLLERTLRPEFCVGGERFWKIIRADQNLDTWRPRVHGTQLKALTNCRLPELPEEYAAVEREISSIQSVLRPEVSPQMFVAELRSFVAGVEVWWEGRNARRPNVDQGAAAGSMKRSSAAVGNNFYAPPSKQQQQSQGMTRRSAGLPPADNGMVSSAPPPVEVPMPPTSQPDLGMLMQGAAPFLQALPLPSTPDPPGLIGLNVGGKSYATTSHTLLAAPNSFFWEILTPGPQGEQPNLLRNQNGEIFIDRNGKLFTYVLEHLRSLSNGEPTSPLPEDANELAALAREAEYFNLPSLLNRIRNTAIMPQPNTQAMYDSIYLETGFNSIEGPGLKEMEQRKILVMQQMNHVLAQKALDGFFVAACDCGVNHRDVEDGGMHHNLFYHILLKRVMPVAPSLHPPEVHMQVWSV
ncbi:hypothetical protein DUNSADRAFT_18044 [Dunaliella salina]|uniref:Potassium channel tetramerisation-type BTB domain-containing protein n=1 Tax=Dunaliella salina TaxID=3046 RepID=A0ABQ7GZI6_DUNSA|nr:hypothetical protein DUNSADRAFT_18044 [Dunaliella salina]|eukprot:KAF5840007.1 hypothetical protein DUNSADRAFT_18044 [Dunaliella salina]